MSNGRGTVLFIGFIVPLVCCAANVAAFVATRAPINAGAAVFCGGVAVLNLVLVAKS